MRQPPILSKNIFLNVAQIKNEAVQGPGRNTPAMPRERRNVERVVGPRSLNHCSALRMDIAQMCVT